MIKNLEPILKDLYLISGLNMSIFDTHYQPIASYPHKKSPFCHLIDQNPESVKLCHQCDYQAFQIAKKTGKLYVYQCHFHLYEAVVPLYYYENLSGYLMMGQTLTHSQFDRESIEQLASPYISDQQKLQEAIQKISVHSIEQIHSFASIVNICAEYITLTNRMALQKKELAQEVCEYLHQFYDTDISLNLLCKTFFCSKATLTQSFKKEYHVSIHQYLVQLRLKESLKLLSNYHLTIHDIAYQVGFKDANYYTKVFQKYYHITPSEYRKSPHENAF